MQKNEFNSRLNTIISTVADACKDTHFESVKNWMGTEISNPFVYAATSERCMERQLNDLKGCERQTTFMADLSIGEWYGMHGVFDTIRNAMTSWKDDETYMAEFILCANWKSWEHAARGNNGWVKLWALLYEGISGLMYEYYEGNDAKTSYLWEYLD